MSDDAGKIKGAASILLKGGTLVSEQCAKCGGVQVRFRDKTSCINCGEEKREEKTVQRGTPTDSMVVIEHKINELASDLLGEKDLTIQKQKAELLETYLRILERMRSLASR
jgi:UPF0148 protein